MYSVCSLFAGAGGIDIAFAQAGFQTVWANELEHDNCLTFKQNLPGVTLVEGDIRQIDMKTIPNFDVLVGGFPCQPFSVAGEQKGFADTRGTLFYEICRVIDAKEPAIIFLENVANLIKHDSGRTIQVIRAEIEHRGYVFLCKTMDAYKYGFPQRRDRAYIVCFKDKALAEKFNYPNESELTLHTSDIIDLNTPVDDKWYLKPGTKKYSLMDEAVKDNNLYRFYDTRQGTSRKSGITCGKNGVCFTLLAGMGNWHDREPIVRDIKGLRSVTPYECFMLQGFPSTFRIPDIPERSAYRQAGNTVCVPVVRQIANSIMNVLPPQNEARQSLSVNDLIIGKVRNEKQLQVNLKCCFYHTPQRNIKVDIKAIKYIALICWENNSSAICYVGEIDSTILCPRNAITELPKNSIEPYYRFNVKCWKKPPSPIPVHNLSTISVCNHSLFF